MLATLIRLTGSFQLAEDALQDAVIVAHETFTGDNHPSNVAAWLTTVARRKALDRIRRESKRVEKETEAVRLLSSDHDPSEPTDRLRLVFTCCHPALRQSAQVALALRTIGGLSTEEIARAFLVPDKTMGQRISRAKKKIRSAQIPYRVPDDHELPDRLNAALNVIYLIFTTGHHAPSGTWDSRTDLAGEAIRLARMLFELMPDEAECAGPSCFVFSNRCPTGRPRGSQTGRSSCSPIRIVRSGIIRRSRRQKRLVDNAIRRRQVGPFQLQAAIAVLHGLAPNPSETDWRQIVALIPNVGATHTQTPIVTVNRAVAEAEAGRSRAVGLALLANIGTLDDWHLFWATKADFSETAEPPRRGGRRPMSGRLACEMNAEDRAFLSDRLAALAP